MKDLDFKEIAKQLPSVNSDRNYWFVRTDGGQYYDDFVKKGMIAIGWDEITKTDIEDATKSERLGILDRDASIGILGNVIKKRDKKNNRANYAASQILSFSKNIKTNDIVLIPSYNSSKITFGQVLESEIINVKVSITENDYTTCPWVKRKKVKWQETLTRDELDPNLYKLMYTHHAITEAKYYGEYIDRVINSFYIKDNKAHFLLSVTSTNEIDAKEFFLMGADSLELLEEFCIYANIERNKADVINVKVNLQSPGEIILTGWLEGLFILGIILVFLNGGNLKIGASKSKGLNIEAKTGKEGLIDKIRTFCNDISKNRREKELIQKFMKENKIQDAQELQDILKKLNEKD